MRIAAISDIHGNYWALEKVLAEVALASPDLVVFLGDALIRVPAARETMDLLLSVPHLALRGNYDWFVTGGFPGEKARLAKEPFLVDEVKWIRSILDQEHLEYLSTMPVTYRMFPDTPQEIVFCHASPERVFGGVFPPPEIHHRGISDAQCLALLEGESAPTVLCGHTHAPLDRRVGKYSIFNPGSVTVGWNEQAKLDSYARWALLSWTNGAWEVSHHKVAYDHRLVWDAYRKWELWPYMQQFAKPLWWGEQVRKFAMAI